MAQTLDPGPGTFKVTQLEAAQHQLDTALKLWFADDDPVSVHTLVAAAYQVIHDPSKQNKGPPLIYDNPVIKKDRLQEAVASLKSHQNFFKHADGRKRADKGPIDFDPGLSGLFLGDLGQTESELVSAFLFWCQLHRPDWFDTGRKERLENQIKADQIPRLRGLQKNDLLKVYLNSRAKLRALGLE